MKWKILAFLGLSFFPMSLWAGELNIGGQFWGWNTNLAVPDGAAEFYLPVSIAVEPVTHLTIYAQSELGMDNVTSFEYPDIYTSVGVSYTALSDTTLGGIVELPLKNGAQVFLNLGFNLPTGNAVFMSYQKLLPVEFVDVRYQAVTFGISAMAGIGLSAGTCEYVLKAGYMDPNVYNLSFGLPMGNSAFSQGCDTFFLSASRAQTFSNGSTQAFSLWALFHDPVLFEGNADYQYGPSFDFDYLLQNSKAFSLDAGGQVFSNNLIAIDGSPSPFNARGPRLYADPAYTFGYVTFQGQVHYVFPNDFPLTNINYDGGGWLLGFGPLWKIPLGNTSDLTLSGSYSKIIWQDEGINFLGNRVDVLYDLWCLGVDYDLRF
jgi:hypothetical protein